MSCIVQPGAIATRNGAPSKWDTNDPSEISAVSVLDDDGASGVGAAAAAAVSVALARSWAAAASQKQAAMVQRTASGSLKPGRAGFRLVAAVSNTDLVRLNGSKVSSKQRSPLYKAYGKQWQWKSGGACFRHVAAVCNTVLARLIGVKVSKLTLC